MYNTVILCQVFYSDFFKIWEVWHHILQFGLQQVKSPFTSPPLGSLHQWTIIPKMWLCWLGLLFLIQESWFDSQLLKFLYQVATLMHLKKNIAASNKLTVEVHLWNRRPVGERLYSFQVEQSSMSVNRQNHF